MAIFTGGALGTLIRLTCPNCGEVQARARKRDRHKYDCRVCHRRFSAAEGQAKEIRAERRSSRPPPR
jgi:hypothetical protein